MSYDILLKCDFLSFSLNDSWYFSIYLLHTYRLLMYKRVMTANKWQHEPLNQDCHIPVINRSCLSMKSKTYSWEWDIFSCLFVSKKKYYTYSLFVFVYNVHSLQFIYSSMDAVYFFRIYCKWFFIVLQAKYRSVLWIML